LDSEPRTAFDLDYGLASVRGCYEGWVTYLKVYGRGHLSGCLGWHHSGQWRDSAALAYIGQVQKWVDEQPWTHVRAP
jgi:autotransporter family porin